MPTDSIRLSRREMLHRSVQATVGWRWPRTSRRSSLRPNSGTSGSARAMVHRQDGPIRRRSRSQTDRAGRRAGKPGHRRERHAVAPNRRCSQQYQDAAQKAGLQVASLAIGELNNIPYKSDPRTVPWVSDALMCARRLG